MSESELFRQHLDALDGELRAALELSAAQGAAFDAVVFHAGRDVFYYRDDHPVPFRPAAHFARWTPMTGTDHTVLARPGERPKVVRVRPRDYWYDTSPPPASFWEEEVELAEVESFDAVRDALGAPDRTAYVGPSPKAAAELGLAEAAVEPETLVAALDWSRATKTGYEVSRLVLAAEQAASGHELARKAFKAWGSEREIYWAYLQASDQLGADIPYVPIIALDEKCAILHYQEKRGSDSSPGKVCLVDAGAGCHGYAIDVTRTWAGDDCEPLFLELLAAMDRIERELVALVTPGRPFTEIHLTAHRRVGELLVETGILKAGVDEALDKGLVLPFMPHGVGHLLGLQVHDVGGRQKSPEGGEVPPPEGHPFLRNTRHLEPGHVVTIEPGLYFIPMLLDPHRDGVSAALLDWELIDRLLPHGGIRIEDNVLCTDGAPRDLTRDLIAGPRGE